MTLTDYIRVYLGQKDKSAQELRDFELRLDALAGDREWYQRAGSALVAGILDRLHIHPEAVDGLIAIDQTVSQRAFLWGEREPLVRLITGAILSKERAEAGVFAVGDKVVHARSERGTWVPNFFMEREKNFPIGSIGRVVALSDRHYVQFSHPETPVWSEEWYPDEWERFSSRNICRFYPVELAHVGKIALPKELLANPDLEGAIGGEIVESMEAMIRLTDLARKGENARSVVVEMVAWMRRHRYSSDAIVHYFSARTPEALGLVHSLLSAMEGRTAGVAPKDRRQEEGHE